jgi:microcystin-dependent protein
MADPFVAEIRIFGFNFAPKGWAFCNGQLIPISQNTALFSLLGTTYGGDGKSTFALPNLEGSVGIQPGQGKDRSQPGPPKNLSLYDLGQQGGTEVVTLLETEMPAHNHAVFANSNPSNLATPSSARSWARSAPGTAYNAGGSGLTEMAPQAAGVTGGGLPHNNLMPYLTLNFCIAMQGVFPPRS